MRQKYFLIFASVLFFSHFSEALELDWSGQFRTEAHYVLNYALDSSNIAVNAAQEAGKGYYISGGGSNKATFQTLFLKLRPKIIVNDNIYLKSEWWVSDPIYGFFGSVPYTVDQRQYYSTQSRGSLISAQRLWAEFLSDIGTFQVGRAPLHWGLGVVWSQGDGLWDRYESTGDVIRLVSKFGSFSFNPALIKYSQGNNIGGAAGVLPYAPVAGDGTVMDYSLMLKYENPDEDFEGGVYFVKRIAGSVQDRFLGIGTTAAQTAVGMNFNIWDLYAQKKFSRIKLAGEVPITSGQIAGIEYSSYAIALEAGWKITDSWDLALRAGQAPGQQNITTAAPDKYKIFYFNPNYRLGLIMFNYQLANFQGPNTQNNPATAADALLSPFDNPITNANYVNMDLAFHLSRWSFHSNWTFAQAKDVAAPGYNFYNTWKKLYVPAIGSQSRALGWEMDYGAMFQWDEAFQFKFDFGFFFPGAFYKFSNTATENTTSTVIAGVAKVGLTF
ncbi:MAG: hypothetical protein HY843_08610 [Bdellovibrio sp.]|nr:hypothetical protein [Bdellovibrio sp.]